MIGQLEYHPTAKRLVEVINERDALRQAYRRACELDPDVQRLSQEIDTLRAQMGSLPEVGGPLYGRI